MHRYLSMLVAAALTICAADASPQQTTYSFRDALDAIRIVETGGQPNDGVGARGDGGKALGPYQIWKAYHTDAAERDASLTDYQRCLTSKDYSERVVRAYMRRYARAEMKRLEAGEGTLADIEKVARRHNGGSRGDRKTETPAYWKKVRANHNR